MKKLFALLCLWPSLALAQGVDPSTTTPTVFPTVDGNYAMSIGPAQQVFWDDFGTGTLDVTNRWTSSVVGGGSAATNAVGLTILGSGTTANGSAFLRTQVTFAGRNPGFITAQFNNNIEFPVLTNAYRAWGFLTAPGSPTTTSPLTNAAVFVIDTAGKLRAQTWASGTLNFDQDLSIISSGPQLCNCIAQPPNAAAHRYQIVFRGDNILWFMDGRPVARVLTGAGGPDVNTLNSGAIAIAGAAPPASSATIQINQVTLSDTGNNSVQISDGTFAWRRASVGADGTQAVSLGSASAGSGSAGFPTAATPITASATGTTTATATLAAAAGKFTYLCGFQATYTGATGPGAGTVVASNTVTGSLNYVAAQVAIANNNQVPLIVSFTPCVPSSAVNTTIPVVATLGAGTTNTAVAAWGYQQ